ncbi:MAG TPA: hypothetical protein VGM88_02640 [Kofleriaceae bacterium]|jgi:hypothetical protein
MMRFALCFALLGACHHAEPAAAPSGSGVLAKKVSLSWGLSPSGDGVDVFLAQTDETGKQVSASVGHFAGPCSPVKPAAEMTALLAVDCKGVELQAVVRGNGATREAILMKMPIADGAKPDPMAREELVHVKLPPDAAVEAAN